MKIGYRQWLQMEQLQGRISSSVTASSIRFSEVTPPRDDATYKALRREVISTVKNGWDLKSTQKV